MDPPHRRAFRRPLPDRAADRHGRHGRRLPGRATSRSDRRVAIKILAERYARDEAFVERFRREATAAAGPLPPQHRVGLRPRRGRRGPTYIAMEYLDGQTLKDEITSRAPLPEAEVVNWAVAGARRARVRPPPGRRPPRRQAPQHDPDRRGPAQGDGLRHRPRGERRADDRGRLDRGHRAVPLARAGARARRRPAVRPLLDGDRALRDADRRAAVHRRLGGRDRDEAGVRPAAVDPEAEPARVAGRWSRS